MPTGMLKVERRKGAERCSCSPKLNRRRRSEEAESEPTDDSQ
jgi:hypothetical protein